ARLSPLRHRQPPPPPLFPYTPLFRSNGGWLRHRCHMVRDGRFFLCTRPPHLADVHGRPQLADEGVELRGEQLQRRLLDYLTADRSEEHTSELQSRENLVCRLLLEKKK